MYKIFSLFDFCQELSPPSSPKIWDVVMTQVEQELLIIPGTWVQPWVLVVFVLLNL
jgi:hypothetical protein